MTLLEYRRAFIIMSLVAFSLLTFSNSFGQDTITAEKVVRHFIRLSLNNLSSNQLKVTGAKAFGLLNGDSVEAYVLKMPPDKLYMKFALKEKGSMEIIYNHGKAINKANGESVSITDPIMLDELNANAFLLKDMAYESLGYTMKLVPADSLEGSQYKIEFISPKGTKTYKFYDKQTGYLTKSIYEDGSTSFFTEYFTINGFTTSRKERDISNTGSVSEIYILEFLINPKYDPSIFDF